MNGSTGEKIRELLHIAGISLSVVVITATLLRLGLVPKNRVQRRQENISVQELARRSSDNRHILYSLKSTKTISPLRKGTVKPKP
jgi:hypothetical protein